MAIVELFKLPVIQKVYNTFVNRFSFYLDQTFVVQDSEDSAAQDGWLTEMDFAHELSAEPTVVSEFVGVLIYVNVEETHLVHHVLIFEEVQDLEAVDFSVEMVAGAIIKDAIADVVSVAHVVKSLSAICDVSTMADAFHQTDYRLGECFTKVENMMCKNRLLGVKCTKVACCATVGKAWGVPCRLCPKNLDCPRGYIPNIKKKKCEDANECTMIPNICAGGTCVNTLGSYRCDCGEGRVYDGERHRCADVDECKKNPNICGNGGKCENLDGSYKCSGCKNGAVLNKDKTKCVGPAEVKVVGKCYEEKDNGKCMRPFRMDLTKKKCCCQNIGKAFGKNCEMCPALATSAYIALCISGTKPGVVTDSSGTIVTDSAGNPVTKPVTSSDGFCFVTRENGVCSRPSNRKVAKSICCCVINGAGFGDSCDACPAKGSIAHNRLCMTDPDDGTDITKIMLNECVVQGPSICKNGKCTDLAEGYMCTCNKGFKRLDKNTCVDNDECSTFTGICGKGRCRNTDGSFKCDCSKGFQDVPDSEPRCQDVDECDQPGTCQNGKCRNLPGGYSCTCNKGFEEKDGGCADIDECKIQNIMCKDGMCENTAGSYMCTCREGYELAADKRTCVDTDECSKSGTCENGACTNLVGSFKCSCNDGFVPSSDGKSCIDVNECQNKDICMHGKCINGPGSYRCACDFGFTPSIDGKACLDTIKGACFAKFDGRMCAMPLMKKLTRTQCCCGMEPMGQRGWGQPCQGCPLEGSDEYKMMCPCKGMVSCKQDVDECKNNAGMVLGMCKHGRCVNTMGDFYCACSSGYRSSKDRKTCNDINECAETPEVCMNGVCKNTNGSFECECPKGYVYSRATGKCVDVDECENGNPCTNAECINTPGSFKCKCTKKGQTLDSTGLVCADVRVGKCWSKQTNDVCENSINGEVTKAVCCKSLGVAWGSPCEKCEDVDKKPDGCKKGFVKKGDTCADIDECKIFDQVCKNGYCQNTPGSFKCVCPTGYTLDDSQRNCLDTRRGACYESFTRDSCKNPIPGNQTKSNCCCSVIGKAWGTPCEICPLKDSPSYNELCKAGKLDVNECLFGMCKNGKCINTQGSFKCICDRGYDVDEKGKACEDIDECKIAKGICGSGKCINTPGSFRCQCEPGYRNSMMMEMCMDIDECTESNPMPCMGGRCINTQGSYRCECPAGTEVMGGGIDCEDIDECTRIPGVCRYGRCQNFNGGYLCACASGFKQSRDMKSCLDVDECQINNGGCEYICNNTIGSYECKCQDGYQLTANKRNCEDIDECTRNPDVCGEGNECKNVIGGHVCSCNTGYEATADGKACVDVDECKDKNSCQNGKCLNTAGSFMCECRKGFKLNKQAMACIDIDECASGDKGGCHKDARCVNTVGSFQCQCKPGYEGNGKECQDLDECKLGLSTCSLDADCTNTLGSFTCQCKAGFSGDGRTCVDINECVEDKTLCKYGQCSNTIGGYECSCYDFGFQRSADKKSCLDIDECVSLKGVICNHGKCINLVGGFKCECDVGFQLDKTNNNCTDINECETSGMCTNGKCVNMMGMYKCDCNPGYVPNKEMNACIDNRREPCYRVAPNASACSNSVASAVMKSDCCCSRFGKAWGKVCEICPPRDSDEYKSLCPGGTGTATNGTMILDIDECKKFNNYCKNGKCVNTKGGSKCFCPDGFFLNRMENCEDIDECKTPFLCGPKGKCINTPGSYRCECPTGVTLKSNNFCVDERKSLCFHTDSDQTNNTLVPLPITEECTEKFPMNFTYAQCCCNMGTHYGDPCETCPVKDSDQYNALCIGKPDIIKPTSFPVDGITPTTKPSTSGTGGGKDGDKDKTKPGGLGGDGDGDGDGTIDPSFDVDECKMLGNPCKKGKCTNTLGGYKCECDMGYKSTGSIKMPECIDVDECMDSPCENGTCKNFEGGFMCECPKGFDLDNSGRVCLDVNECAKPGICENGVCTNTIGSFQCKCKSGYALTMDMKSCEDADECSIPNICGAGKCKNLLGSYECICNEGFRRDTFGQCDDIDECIEAPGICQNGKCKNTRGSFECECDAGFVPTGNKQNCRDLDECLEVADFCKKGTCTNTFGSATCKCNEGYERIKDKCIDINECTQDPELCEIGGTCINTEGSFRCLCNNAGFRLGNQGRSCVDVRKGVCFAKVEGNRCAKATAFQVTKSTCCCSMNAGWGDPCDLCPKEGTKEFTRYCPNGIGYNKDLSDINECLLNYGECKNGKCVNTDGSYRCDCSKGYKKSADPNFCVDIDECVELNNVCGNGNCTNTVGSYSCKCNAGYERADDSPSCVDINECNLENDLCAHRCSNIPGSYRCMCPRGFKVAADGRMCEDIDECKTSKNTCKQLCKNILGGFICLCGEGYRQIGGKCVDINECAENKKLCKPFGTCQNFDGGYRCQCTPPYMRSKNGKLCQDMRRGLCFAKVIEGVCQAATKKMMKVSEGECCCMGALAWGPSCTPCPLQGSIKYNLLCSKDGHTVNECDMIAGVCENGKCMDTDDTYMCMCNPGFKLSMNGKKCTDIDECKNNPCELGCTNTMGGYECKCQQGFKFDLKAKKCVDIDECKSNAHNCDHKCVNTVGSFRCACPDGYHKMGASCVDTDECLYNQYICGYGHQCINTPGGYTCRCQMGYIFDKEKKQCVDIDECYGNTQCQYGCENTEGSYRCNCPKGYSRHYFYNQCVDVNECETGACGSGSNCQNALGTYSCSCGSGFNYQNGVCRDVDECGSQNPCQYSCKNTQGGFECGCPYGLRPNQGHCIVATGITCTTCDDAGDDDAVPLQKEADDEPTTSAVASAVGTDSLPLVKGEDSTDAGFFQSGFYQQQSGGFQYPQGQFPSGFQQPYSGFQGGFQGGANRQFSGYSAYDYTGGSSNPYSNQRFGVRSLRFSRGGRGSRGGRRPMVISVGKDLKTKIPLLKFLPAIKGLKHKVEYVITAGNVTLFEISQKGRLGFLHSTQPLKEGSSYALKIGSRIKSNKEVDSEAKLWFNKKKFNLKLVVKVV
eukprot:gene5941-11289_t